MAAPNEPSSSPVLCTALVLGTSSVGTVGPATLVTVSKFDEQFLNVMVNGLPSPSSLSPRLTGYTLLLLSPENGVIILRQELVPVPTNAGTWGGSAQMSGGDTFPKGLVLIFASTVDGLLGPQIATGNLAECQ